MAHFTTTDGVRIYYESHGTGDPLFLLGGLLILCLRERRMSRFAVATVGALGAWVLAEACRQTAAWRAAYPEALRRTAISITKPGNGSSF